METKTISPSKDIVLSFLKALNENDFKTARRFVQDDLLFEGVLGSRDGAEAYFNDMERMKLKYEVKKVFVDREDVCVLYDIDMSGEKIFTCGWYKIKENKIASLRVVFDPRPVLAKS